MLELAQVISDIQKMGAEARKRGDKTAKQMRTALIQANLDQDAWAATRPQRESLPKPSWLAADCRDVPPSSTTALPPGVPAVYTALATDGSQIPLDRHAVAPCYLINVGEIALHYGTGERPTLESQATLHYRDEDLYQTESGGDPVPLSDKIIANRRLLAESAALAKLIETHQDREAIALVDDPLIVWTPQGESETEQRRIIDGFCKMLAAGQIHNTPVVGYVSRPAHRDVVGALRLTLCEPGCPHDTKNLCAELASLTDVQLFTRLLPSPGDRSPVFGSNARSLDLYPSEQRIAFFYLNAGSEIARVEVPQWVAEDADLTDRVHRLCFDQARKGQGYPIALAEAHERAIVRGPEREAFFRLVENAFVRENLPALQTRKALSKRTRVL
jgi:hypothetical protein